MVAVSMFAWLAANASAQGYCPRDRAISPHFIVSGLLGMGLAALRTSLTIVRLAGQASCARAHSHLREQNG